MKITKEHTLYELDLVEEEEEAFNKRMIEWGTPERKYNGVRVFVKPDKILEILEKLCKNTGKNVCTEYEWTMYMVNVDGTVETYHIG